VTVFVPRAFVNNSSCGDGCHGTHALIRSSPEREKIRGNMTLLRGSAYHAGPIPPVHLLQSFGGMRGGGISAFVLVLLGCYRGGDHPDGGKPPPPAKQPSRVAVQDDELRVMLAQIASAKACDLIRGQFRGLRDPARPGTVTGVVWIRGCQITQRGTDVTFRLSANGWQWTAQKTKKAGATFAVRQYVKFGVDATILGKLDLAYAPGTHVLSFWYTPAREPVVTFTPIGGVDVDEQGTWSSIVGALSSVFGSSPDKQGQRQATREGTAQFKQQFADGLAVTIDLCSGLSRFGLGRPGTGKMVPPDVGETHRVLAELQPDGLLVFGPYLAKKGLTAHIHVRGGPVKAALHCADDSEDVADAFMHGRPQAGKPLAAKEVRGEATLRTPPGSCPVVLVARPLAPSGAPAIFDWQRPPSEAAQSTGGSIIRCGG
jgi:hypothetical protein